MITEAEAKDTRSFYELENMILDAIAAQYSAHQRDLCVQFRSARVTSRHNSGAGFFTSFAVDKQQAVAVDLPRILCNIWADVQGFEQPMTFLVFMENGFAKMLEGALAGGETTCGIDFSQLGCVTLPPTCPRS